jgi:hypothetical protein
MRTKIGIFVYEKNARRYGEKITPLPGYACVSQADARPLQAEGGCRC